MLFFQVAQIQHIFCDFSMRLFTDSERPLSKLVSILTQVQNSQRIQKIYICI